MATIADIIHTITIRGVADGVDATTAATKGLKDAFDTAAMAAKSSAGDISGAFDGIQKSIGASGAGGAGGGMSFLASIGIGAAASAAGLGAFLDWVQKTNKELGDMGAAAKQAALNLTDFQKLQFATGAQGVSSDTFATGAAKMATSLNDATRGENELSKLLDANNIKFKDANGLLVNTNQMFNIARGLIANGANEFDKIKIADMLGLTKEWVPALEQSVQAFTASKNEATSLGLVIDSDTIAKAAIFTQEWQKSSLVFSTWMKAQLADVIPVIDDLIGKAKEYGSTMTNAIKNGPPSAGAGAANATPNTAEAQANSDAFNARVNAMLAVDGTDKTLIESLKAYWDALTGKVNENTKALQENKAVAETSVAAALKAFDEGAAMHDNLAGGIGGHPLAPTKMPTSAAKDGGRDYWDRATDAIDKHAAKLAADTIAEGQSTAAQAQLRAEFSLLEAAKQSDRDVTDEQIAKYTELRATMTANQALQGAGINWSADEKAAFDRTTGAIKDKTEAFVNAKIQQQISFGRQTAFFTTEDVAIANQLKEKYPEVAAAMNSAEATALRFAGSFKEAKKQQPAKPVKFVSAKGNSEKEVDCVKHPCPQAA